MSQLRRRFKVTHPFHPLYLKEFELLDYRRSWGEPYVECFDHNNDVVCIPLAWTDAGDLDPFNQLANGRSIFRVAELMRLVELIDDLKKDQTSLQIDM